MPFPIFLDYYCGKEFQNLRRNEKEKSPVYKKKEIKR